MAEDLLLDTAIRDWVLIPLSVVMVLIGVLRYFVSKLLRSSQPPNVKLKEGKVVLRARNLITGANFIPESSFRSRRAYFTREENGLLFVPKGQAQNAQAQMFSDPNMAMDMMKKNLSMIIPQTLTFAWVNFFFSGFVAAKIPFPLTQRFRGMLQNGIDLSTVDVSYVSSRSCSAAQVQNSTSTGSKRKGGTGGLNKLCGVSPELQVIVGEPAMPRTQIVKQLWAYIRRNNLQDPSNKRKIICNDALRLVFETDCTDMFKMNKLLAKHILPLEPASMSTSDPALMVVKYIYLCFVEDAASDLKSLKATCSDSQVQGVSTGSVPVIMSEALTDFFGNGERELPQQETLKRIWNYIQMNHLEDPLNSVIVCDYRLRELFSCEKFAVGNLPDMLSHHYLKK